MSYWKTGYRKINGHRRKVVKLVQDGKIRAVRIANRNHYTDKTAKKYGIAHVRGHVNNPNSAKRVNHYR
jgi:4-hydroxyphenylpyruvate dioxygenase-like putative hemolysin